MGIDFWAMKKPTKDVVIENTKTLMKMHGDTTHSLAKRSGLPQSTVSNILSGRHKISVEACEAIGSAYGLESWHLLLRNLPNDLIESPTLGKLVEAYIKADSEGREYIDTVAERESKYKYTLR